MSLHSSILRSFASALILCAGAQLCPATDQTAEFTLVHSAANIPFELAIEQVNAGIAELPTLHSYVLGHSGTAWLFLGGRTNGLHGMTGQGAFPTASANSDLWVVDLAAGRSWRRPLSETGLPDATADFLSATNHNFVQEGSLLYVAGGYGWSRSIADYVTFSHLARIDVPALIRWVKNEPGSPAPSQSIQTVQYPLFQVTGGALEKPGAHFLLVFGQNYPGRYRPNFNGTYTKQVRRFALAAGAALQLDPTSVSSSPPVEDYRRRDLNVVTALRRGQTGELIPDTLALAGVFTPTTGVWTVPVTITPEGVPAQPDPLLAATFKQGLHHYHSAKVTLFHRVSGDNFIIQFGGLSAQFQDPATSTWIKDPQVPFVHHVSCIVRNQDGTFHQVLLPEEFPVILSPGGARLFFGTNAEFIIPPGVPQLRDDVIDLAAVQRPQVIGYIYGGLVSDAPNGGATRAGGEIFRITLTPVSPPGPAPTVDLTLEADGSLQLSWTGDAGAFHLLEQSSDLVSWAEMWPPVKTSPVVLPPGSGRRFYRLLQAAAILPPQ